MAYTAPKELLELLEPYDRGLQEIALALRQVVLEELAPCCEYILEVYTISLLYGPTPKMSDNICYIALAGDHVNLGFNDGASLSNFNRLLEGTGKQMRHIKCRSLADVRRRALRDYLRDACDLAGHDVSGAAHRNVEMAVKRKSVPKKSIGIARP